AAPGGGAADPAGQQAADSSGLLPRAVVARLDEHRLCLPGWAWPVGQTSRPGGLWGWRCLSRGLTPRFARQESPLPGDDIRTVGLGGASRSRGSQTAIVRGWTVASLAAATRPGQDTVDRQRRQVAAPGKFEAERGARAP